MARKQKPAEAENHERWVISYADFITLLFAFFVIMYGMSSVNEGKYREFSGSLRVAFKIFQRSNMSHTLNELVGTRAGTDPKHSRDEGFSESKLKGLPAPVEGNDLPAKIKIKKLNQSIGTPSYETGKGEGERKDGQSIIPKASKAMMQLGGESGGGTSGVIDDILTDANKKGLSKNFLVMRGDNSNNKTPQGAHAESGNKGKSKEKSKEKAFTLSKQAFIDPLQALPHYMRSNDLVDIRKVDNRLKRAFEGLIDNKLMKIRSDKNWVKLELRSSILFGSGEAKLHTKASYILKKISRIIQHFDFPIFIEGHTDNVPIHNKVYPSNWELSAARAAVVVRTFVRFGIDPDKMVAIGYGENYPVASNTSIDGRQKNRRVMILIAKHKNIVKSVKIEEIGKEKPKRQLLRH